jgi:hypothetical protein
MVEAIIEGRIVDMESRPLLLFELGKALVLYRGPRYRFDQMADKGELQTVHYVTHLFEKCTKNAETVVVLVICAMRFRLGVPKDICSLLGKQMWSSRFDFEWFRLDFLEARDDDDADKKCTIS